MEQLTPLSPNLFQDTLLLSGSNVLEPFPPVAEMNDEDRIRELIHLFMGPPPRSALQVCASYGQNPVMKEKDYLTRCKAAITNIRHPVITLNDGTVCPRGKERIPGDVHECVGLQLPWEMMLYMRASMVTPRVFSHVSTGNIHVAAPLVGGESKAFQDFVRNGLDPIRRQSLSLVISLLNRWYSHREFDEKFFSDPDRTATFTARDLPYPPKALRWQVKSLPAKLKAKATDVSSGAMNSGSCAHERYRALLRRRTCSSFSKASPTKPSPKAPCHLVKAR